MVFSDFTDIFLKKTVSLINILDACKESPLNIIQFYNFFFRKKKSLK